MIPGLWLLATVGADPGEREEHEHEEHDEHEHEHEHERGGARPSVAPVTDPTWAAECGSCHLAYPPGLLPARSWGQVLSTLGQHFGDDATVDEPTRSRLEAYARANAADAPAAAPYALSRAIARGAAGSTPQRILDVGFLRREHREEVSAAAVARARSLSNCGACHPGAARGWFSDD